MKPVAVVCSTPPLAAEAAALAERLGLPLFEGTENYSSAKERLRFLQSQAPRLPALVFLVKSGGLELALIDQDRIVSVKSSFHDAGISYRRLKGGGRSEMIAKAVGLRKGKRPAVLDATAGLGVDGFILASLGCVVTLIEREPSVHALLEDGLKRSRAYAAGEDKDLEEILQRITLLQADALDCLKPGGTTPAAEVIYLDPMFPERKKAAAVKKEMQIFHRLVGPDSDADGLLAAALDSDAERVVVKRPRVAPPLAGSAPSHVLAGKRNRYDIYFIH